MLHYTHQDIHRCALSLTKPCLFFLLSLFPLFAEAQANQDTLIHQISRDILQLIGNNLEEGAPDIPAYNPVEIDALFNIRSPQLELASNELLYTQLINQEKRDIGVDLKVQYAFNSDPFFNDNEIGYEYNRFRLRAGFDWDLFKNGFFGNRLKVKQLEKEMAKNSIEEQMEQNDNRLYFEYNTFIYYFNEAKIKLLKERYAQLDKQLELLYKVYFLKGILYEEVINTRSRLEQTNVQLTNYQQYNESMEKALGIQKLSTAIDVYKLPVLEVAIDSMVHDTDKQQLIDSLNRLTFETEALRNHPINDITLRLNAFENISFIDDGRLDRTYTSVGVSLGVPLHMLYSKNANKEIARIKAGNQGQFNNYEHLNKQTEIINYYYEYQYKLKQYVEFLYKEMLYREKIRVEAVSQKNYTDIFRSLDVLRYLDNYRAIQLEMIDLKQQMYLLLLKIYGKTHRQSIIPFIKEINLADYYERLSANRSLVLERSALKNHDKYFIKNYLLTNDFENVIIETADGLDKVEVDALRKVLKNTDVGVFVMTSNSKVMDNALARYQLLERYLDSGLYDGIVLNLANTKTPAQPDQLKEFFANLKNLAKASAQVGIQLPLDFPYLGIAKSCDKVILKLGRNQKVHLLDVVMRNKVIDPKRLFLSVEASRFSDRVDMENFINQITKTYKIENIIIEGLDNFIALDTQVLLKRE